MAIVLQPQALLATAFKSALSPCMLWSSPLDRARLLARLQALLLGLAVRSSRAIPAGWAWTIGSLVGYTYGALLRRDQQRAVDHLARAYPNQTHKWHRQMCRASYRHIGRMALWTLATLCRSQRLRRQLVVSDRANFQAMLDAQQRQEGTIVVAAHAGNWEHLARTVGSHAHVSLLGKRMRSPLADVLIRWLRSRGNAEVLYQEDGIPSCLRALRQGRVLATLPDQDISRFAGCFVPWYGVSAYTPIGPALLAIMGRCAVQVVVMLWEGDRWVAHIGDRLYPEPPSYGSREVRATELTARYTQQIEDIIRRHPDQWVWWHRRWRTQVSKSLRHWYFPQMSQLVSRLQIRLPKHRLNNPHGLR